MIDQDILGTGLNLKVFSGAWTLEGDFSYSSAEHFYDGVSATVHGAPSGGFGGPVLTLTYSALGDTPTLSVAENLLDPSIWVTRQYELNDFGNDDQQTAIRAAATGLSRRASWGAAMPPCRGSGRPRALTGAIGSPLRGRAI